MPTHALDFEGAVAHIRSRVGSEASVEVLGHDPAGDGTVMELTGVLRAVGNDPDAPVGDEHGPRMFGFEGQANAFHLDPDAFIAAEATDGHLWVTTTFGALVFAGPIRRPEWF